MNLVNLERFNDFWCYKMDCEGMATGVTHVYKMAKEATLDLRRADLCTVAERDRLLRQFDAHQLRCKSALGCAA
jgi:hypothetical protein